jgi:hypothetical protein
MDADSRLVRGTIWDSIRFNPIHANFNSGSIEQVSSVLLRSNVVTGATLMFRSELREHLMQFPSEWVHDGWLAWMIALHSRLVAVPETLIRYRVHKKQQVSIPRHPITDRLRRARLRGMDDCLETARQFEILLKYAKSHTAICSPQLRKGFEEKRDHLYFRAGLAGNRIKRWSQIGAERHAYRLYAQGWLSMFKDAFV